MREPNDDKMPSAEEQQLIDYFIKNPEVVRIAKDGTATDRNGRIVAIDTIKNATGKTAYRHGASPTSFHVSFIKPDTMYGGEKLRENVLGQGKNKLVKACDATFLVSTNSETDESTIQRVAPFVMNRIDVTELKESYDRNLCTG